MTYLVVFHELEAGFDGIVHVEGLDAGCHDVGGDGHWSEWDEALVADYF